MEISEVEYHRLLTAYTLLKHVYATLCEFDFDCTTVDPEIWDQVQRITSTLSESQSLPKVHWTFNSSSIFRVPDDADIDTNSGTYTVE